MCLRGVYMIVWYKHLILLSSFEKGRLFQYQTKSCDNSEPVEAIATTLTVAFKTLKDVLGIHRRHIVLVTVCIRLMRFVFN
jgi:hypothetical protein